MSRTRTTRDLCQTCWQDANPTEYCPDLNRYGTCAECGWDDVLVVRSTIAFEAPREEAAPDPEPLVAITLAKTHRGDFVMHRAGCADLAKHLVSPEATYTGETLLAAIIAADTDMADWFCTEPYESPETRPEHCWATAVVGWAPCFADMVKAEGITFDRSDRPHQ